MDKEGRWRQTDLKSGEEKAVSREESAIIKVD
jgi:hypothetical protein